MKDKDSFYAGNYMFAIYDRQETLLGVCDNKWELDDFFKKNIKFSRLSKSIMKDRVMLIDNCIVYHIPVYEITKDIFESEDLVFAEMFRKLTLKERKFNTFLKKKNKKLYSIEGRER